MILYGDINYIDDDYNGDNNDNANIRDNYNNGNNDMILYNDDTSIITNILHYLYNLSYNHYLLDHHTFIITIIPLSVLHSLSPLSSIISISTIISIYNLKLKLISNVNL